MKAPLWENRTPKDIGRNILLAFLSLFVNGFGVYLTMHADIGASPWDVFNLGLSHTFGILYGTASITVSILILLIDILMKEPIGVAMFIDAVTVGKAVDFFNWLNIVPVPKTLFGKVAMLFVGIVVIGYTMYFYMIAALGCGPRDTLMVGLKRRMKKLPIGAVNVLMLSIVTLIGSLLGGPVGIGTLLCAFGVGPVMQFAFMTMRFDATTIHHQNLIETGKILLGQKKAEP